MWSRYYLQMRQQRLPDKGHLNSGCLVHLNTAVLQEMSPPPRLRCRKVKLRGFTPCASNVMSEGVENTFRYTTWVCLGVASATLSPAQFKGAYDQERALSVTTQDHDRSILSPLGFLLKNRSLSFSITCILVEPNPFLTILRSTFGLAGNQFPEIHAWHVGGLWT